jgi:hypothetical protein
MTPEPTSDAIPQNNRREFDRRRLRAEIEIEWGSATLTATVRDIGPRGLFVELTPPLWVGAAFHARLLLNPVLQLDCTVRRVEPNSGFAVSFEPLEERDKAQLRSLLAALPQV